MEKEEKINSPVYKKWWFWAIIIFYKKCCFWAIIILLILGIAGYGNNTNNANIDVASSSNTIDNSVTYTLTGETLGEYGKKVVLNKNTDLPVTKYLYKIPSGNYVVTTNYNKLSEFWIVKDEVVNTGSDSYPEELSYVGSYDITAGTDDFNGRAKKEVSITISDDESILINGKETLMLKKIN